MEEKKIIISLTGSPTLKNRFGAVLSEKNPDGSWVWHRWNVTPENPMRNSVNDLWRLIGLEAMIGTENAEKMRSDFYRLCEKHMGFREKYARYQLQQFENNLFANLLVFHGLGKELVGKLRSEGFRIHTIHLAEQKDAESGVNPTADLTIFESSDFETVVKEALNSFEN